MTTSDSVDDLGAICRYCAEGFGCEWPANHVATYWPGVCPYCGRDTVLCGTNDYVWPDGKMRGEWD